MKHALLALFILVSIGATAQVTLTNLKTNYRTTPLGTDITTPQFSWQMTAPGTSRGVSQNAYQIAVKNEKGLKIWDSGKVNSDQAHAIQYAGEALQPSTRYTWELTVWDNLGKQSKSSSWFETGLMDPSENAWSGAQWIGGGAADDVFYPHYLSVFKFSFAIQLDKNTGSNKGAFVFGANDTRLANRYLNLMGVEKGKNESYVALELDISSLNDSPESKAKLNIFRVGYTNNDKADVPFQSLDIPQNIINQQNKYNKHQIYAECNFGLFEFFVDGIDNAHKLALPGPAPTSAFASRGLNLNPVGSGNNFISFPMLADMGFKTEAGQTAYFSDLSVKNFRFPSNVVFEDSNNQLLKNVPKENGAYRFSGQQLITADASRNATPMLRTAFQTKSNIKKARLYVTARGIYEVYLNGKRVSEEYFNPGLTQYNKHHQYQTYDVTPNLIAGKANALGAWLSEGWWSGNITYSGESWNFFGDRQSLLAKMVITYVDGSEQIITSNSKDWKLFTDGPIRYGSYFQGEVYDAGKEAAIQGWTSPGFNDVAWKTASVVPLDGNAYLGTFTERGRTSTFDYKDFQLIGNMDENVKIVRTLTARSVKEVRPKVYVYDMGQNMVGIPKILIKNGRKGQVINLRFAEIAYPTLPDYKGNEGMIMLENIRAALTQDRYILKGGDEVIQPRFTFHGYQYLEITGIDAAIPVENVKGLVLSSVHKLSSLYETNNRLVNKLWENITWSLRSNFLSIPTDCPQRNERMGWSGDISVFSKAATYLADAPMFLRRHMLAMRDIQAENGRFTDVAPVGGGFGGTLWGSAGITVAWETYRQYGDIQLLQEHYPAMKRYVDFLETKIEPQTGILNEGPLGDWLSPEGNKNDNTLFWMAYYAYDLYILAKMARELGNNVDYVALNERSLKIKEKFNKTYLNEEGKTVKSGIKTGFMGAPNESDTRTQSEKGNLMDTQASYAIPLALNTFSIDIRPKIIEHFKASIVRKNVDDSGVTRPAYSLMTGFIGTAAISEALSQYGAHDLAYKLLTNKEYPSWLYSVVNGSSTIWERLNSYTVENGFGGNNSMNSFNHYSFGAVAAWMYHYSLGIQRDLNVPAFKSFILQPTLDPNGEITSASGYFDSMYGRIKSEWKIENGTLVYNCTVPANTSATLYLPAKQINQVKESGRSLVGWKDVGVSNDKVVIPLGSGTYKFVVQ
ncbi:MAG: family 78 glycoside hydrolase catalytic domain [Haliscomenobacter sp.]|uniref:family 78 glycoside hydrolase catalytic domain n=1 Tax=Haliscomenobacter sp. TaxID=2717303 RepID=UPI0029A14E54|nr:family 78 glycoside hydrolase catalytic domain [Haliscomenobacter sp.]MDX2067512.1 family 78 glycoside hydrolase catalytic domain [Haliscomenobacter sp.]